MSLPILFDNKHTNLILRRAKEYIQEDPFIQKNIEANILQRLESFLNFNPKHILVSGICTKSFMPFLNNLYPKSTIEFLWPEERNFISLNQKSFDLVLAINFFHHINDLPGVLSLVYNALKANGLFLTSLFGENTLRELEELFWQIEERLYKKMLLHTMPKIDIKTLGSLLQRSRFSNPVADQETYTIEYDSLSRISTDIKTLGLSSTLIKRSKKPLRKDVFYEATKHIKRGIFLTYDTLYATGYKL